MKLSSTICLVLLVLALAQAACSPMTSTAPSATPTLAQATPTATATPLPPTATFTAVLASPTPLPPVNSVTPIRPTSTPRPSPTPPVVVSQPFDGGGIPNAIFVFIRTSPGATNVMMFQVKASEDNPNNSDGKGIANVEFHFCLSSVSACNSSNRVYGRTETNQPYCAFQDTNGVCNRWVLAEHGNKWPNNAPIKSGNYVLRAVVNGKNDAQRSNDLNFTITLP